MKPYDRSASGLRNSVEDARSSVTPAGGANLIRQLAREFADGQLGPPDICLLYDRCRRIQYLRGSAFPREFLFPTSPVGKTDEEVFRSEIAAITVPALQTVLDSAEATSVCLPWGHDRNLRMSYIPLLDDAGQVQEILGVRNARCDTAGWQASQFRREWLELALDGGQMAAWEWDVLNDRHVWSPRKFELLGMPVSQEPQPQRFRDLIYREDRGRFQESVRTAIRSGRELRLQFRIVRPDGQLRWMETRARAIRNSEGVVCRLIGVTFDVTRRKAAERTLLQLNRNLENQVQERTAELAVRTRRLQQMAMELTEAEHRERARLAQYLHDDLQQLLVAAKREIEFLQRNPCQKPLHEELERIRSLLTESIAASRSLTFDLCPPVLHQEDLCSALEWLQKQMIQKHDLHVDLSFSGQQNGTCESIKVLLFTAIRELLYNVRKHAQVDCASVRVQCDRREVQVQVADGGVGLDVAHLKQKEGRGEGGFGLFSIRERVELLGGSFRIDSTEGQGSRFTIRVPVRE